MGDEFVLLQNLVMALTRRNIMPDISQIQNSQGFAQDFLTHYFASGFGGMQKRDLDTLVFGLLLKYGAFGGSADSPDVTEISFQLGISPARVRNLLRDAQLRYLQYDEHEAKIRFIKLFESARFEQKDSYVTFSVSDPLLQQYFTRWLNQVNGFFDATFNPNLIKISYEALADVFLLLNHQDEGALDQFESRIRTLTTTNDLTLPPEPVRSPSETSGIKSFIISSLKALVTGAATEIGKQVILQSLQFILKV